MEIRIERESSNQRKFNEIETAENSIEKLAKRSFWLKLHVVFMQALNSFGMIRQF